MQSLVLKDKNKIKEVIKLDPGYKINFKNLTKYNKSKH